MKYINTLREKSHATFVRVEPTFDDTQIDVSSSSVTPQVAGQAVKMVKATVRITTPSEVRNCNDECVAHVNEAVALSFNLRQGGANLAALKAEVIRVFDDLVANYQLVNGVVPPATADFDSN